MEANDQAALMPNNVDPMAAAQQVAKAIENAKEADEAADEAAKAEPQPMNGMQPMAGMPMEKGNMPPMAGMPMDGMPPPPNLADLQKQVAKQAADAKQPEAAKAAGEAAKALDKGDLMAARQPEEGPRRPQAGRQPAEDGMPMAMQGCADGRACRWKASPCPGCRRTASPCRAGRR